jgi:hypothetical protein
MMNASMTTKKLAVEMLVKPSTKITYGQGPWAYIVTKAADKAHLFMRYNEEVDFWNAIWKAAKGINYALTGRCSSIATCNIFEMSAYQVLKLIAEIAAAGVELTDVPSYLDAKAKKEGWK